MRAGNNTPAKAPGILIQAQPPRRTLAGRDDQAGHGQEQCTSSLLDFGIVGEQIDRSGAFFTAFFVGSMRIPAVREPLVLLRQIFSRTLAKK